MCVGSAIIPRELTRSLHCFTERAKRLNPASFLIPSNSMELKSGLYMFPDSQKLDCVSVSKSVSDENRSIFGVSDHIGKRDVIVVFDFLTVTSVPFTSIVVMFIRLVQIPCQMEMRDILLGAMIYVWSMKTDSW